MDKLKQSLYLVADEMRGMATIGKHFAGNIYERERAHRIMELAASVAALADERPLEEVKAIFEDEPWFRASPVIGVDAFVLNDNDELLLIKRKDNQHWALPGGISEIGNTFSETDIRELWEEAGLRGRAEKLLGVFDARLWGTTAKVHLINIVFYVICSELIPSPGIETLDAKFFPKDNLPQPLHPGHDRRIPKCIELLDQNAYFDPADSLTMVMSMLQRNGNGV